MKSYNIGVDSHMFVARSKNQQQANKQEQGFTSDNKPGLQNNKLKLQDTKLKLTNIHNLNVFNGNNKHGDVVEFSSRKNHNNGKSELNKKVKPGIEYFNAAMKTVGASGIMGVVAFALSSMARNPEGLGLGVGKKIAATVTAAALPLLTLPSSIYKASKNIQKENNKMNIRDAINDKLASKDNSAEDLKNMAKATKYLK